MNKKTLSDCVLHAALGTLLLTVPDRGNGLCYSILIYCMVGVSI